MKLLELAQNYHAAHDNSILSKGFNGNQVIKAKQKFIPIVPNKKWEIIDGFLFKTFLFQNLKIRNIFLGQILGYEQTTQHPAEQINLTEKEISIKLGTGDHITDLDKEYAKFVDLTFADIVRDIDG